jgi:hypothetical protein
MEFCANALELIFTAKIPKTAIIDIVVIILGSVQPSGVENGCLILGGKVS